MNDDSDNVNLINKQAVYQRKRAALKLARSLFSYCIEAPRLPTLHPLFLSEESDLAAGAAIWLRLAKKLSTESSKRER